MNKAYGGCVFDEWLLCLRNDNGYKLQAYEGPRMGIIQHAVNRDLQPLSALLEENACGVGDFEFVPDGRGTQFDAFVVVGEELVLICNSSDKSMEEIKLAGNWLKAQRPFFTMCEGFRADPLKV